jgi:hypothetical protein
VARTGALNRDFGHGNDDEFFGHADRVHEGYRIAEEGHYVRVRKNVGLLLHDVLPATRVETYAKTEAETGTETGVEEAAGRAIVGAEAGNTGLRTSIDAGVGTTAG